MVNVLKMRQQSCYDHFFGQVKCEINTPSFKTHIANATTCTNALAKQAISNTPAMIYDSTRVKQPTLTLLYFGC